MDKEILGNFDKQVLKESQQNGKISDKSKVKGNVGSKVEKITDTAAFKENHKKVL